MKKQEKQEIILPILYVLSGLFVWYIIVHFIVKFW